jgi:hypothetical protein
MSEDTVRHKYELAVRALRARAHEFRVTGASSEAIARVLHAERRALAARFKDATPEPLRTALYERTFRVYGDRLGPTIEFLRTQGKTWEDIIEGATRPGPLPSIERATPSGSAI